MSEPDTNARQTVAEPSARELASLLLIAVTLLIAGAALLTFHYRIYLGDALSRTYAAASVLYGSHPALANLGFIWAPAPTLLQLPVALYRPLTTWGFSGAIVSAVAGAVGLVFMDRILSRHIPERPFRWFVLFLYQSNVMILFYSINGMTEMVLITIALGCWDYFQRLCGHLDGANGTGDVVLMGIAAGLTFLTRYEGASFGVVMYLVLLIVLAAKARQLGSVLEPNKRLRLLTSDGMLLIEGYSLAYLSPFLYAVFLWLFLNWMIMGNPLYFMFGYGSATQQGQTLYSSNEVFSAMKGNPLASLTYAARATAALFPGFYLAELLLLLRVIRKRDTFGLCLALVMASFPGFQALMNFTGLSFGSLRFYIYLIPFSVVGLAYGLRASPESSRVISRLQRAAVILALLASSAVTLYGVSLTYFLQAEEMVFVRAVIENTQVENFAHEKRVAEYLSSLPENSTILTDDLQADHIILFTQQIERFITTRNPDFMSVALNPVGKVDYILVPRLENTPSLLLSQHPDMYEYGARFLQLEREFRAQDRGLDWRVYRVLAPIPDTSVPANPGGRRRSIIGPHNHS